ncbi:MAG TPA: choice-of-anchor D domain-containing protein [Terriglobales bacterium]|nr:choice-of-anchor D domain-containing protein [Terriglobales bacterium]
MSVNAVAGIATFSGLSVDKVGTGYTLKTTDGTLTPATSSAFNITPGAAAKLVITTQPNSSYQAAAPITVAASVEDAAGNVVTTDTSSVAIAFGTNAGPGTLSGTVSVNAVAGVATFSGLSVDKVGTGYTLKTTDGTLTPATTSAFNITPGTASKLVITTQPNSSYQSAAPIAVAASVEDAAGNVVTTNASAVAIAFGTNAGPGTLSGTVSVNAIAGVATFSGLSVDKVGTGYTLKTTDGTLTPATSTSFAITAGNPAAIVATGGAPQSTAVLAAFSIPLKAQVVDAAQNPVPGVTVTFAAAVSGASGTFAGNANITTVTDSTGTATTATLSANATSGAWTALASVSGLPTAASFALTNNPLNQAIVVGPLTAVTYGTSPLTLSATGGASNLPVTFSIVSGPATLSSNVLTVTGAGSIVIAANQAGNSTYNAAPAVQRTLTVNPALLTVTANSVTRAFAAANPPLTATISGFVNNETQAAVVTGSASFATPAVATSDPGTFPITVSAGTLAAANYTFAFANGTLTVTQASQTITFNPLANHNFGDAPFTVAASATSGLPVTFSIASGPATISGNTVTITGGGVVTVKATQPGNTDYSAATAVSQSFTVNAQATLSFSANSLNFGSVPLGSTSGAQSIIATNSSLIPVTISSIAATGDYSFRGACTTLAPGASCTLSTTFAPTALGTRAGTLTFTDSAAGSPQTVTLTGIGAAPGVVVTPATLVFGSQLVASTSTAQSITIQNTGNATLHVAGVAATGDFAAAGNCSVIPAGSNCSIEVTFTPTQTGNRTGTVTITDDGGSGTQAVAVSGNGSAAGVALSPASLTFPATLIGSTSFGLTANLTNTGTAGLTGIAITGQGDFAETNNCGATLAAGATCTLTVTYSPSLVGPESALIAVGDNLGQQTLAVAGAGVAPGVTLDTTQLIFGGQLVGTNSNAQTVILTNSGNSALTITSITASTNFGDSTNCAGTLAAGASCSVNVFFAPGTTGPLSGTVTLVDSAGTQIVTTTGLGQNQGLQLTPSFAIFGGQVVTTSSLAQTLTLTNTGTATVTLAPITTTGDFQETDLCPATLAPGASCNLSVVFTPTALGNRAGSLSASDTSNLTSALATFNGQGTIPGLVASPSNLNFGTIDIGSTSLTQTVTLTNSGSAPVSVGSITVSGDFAQTNTCNAGPIAPGGLCIISVSMSPTTTGTRTGTVQIVDSAAGVHDIALSGAGQAIGLNIFPTQLAFGSLPIPFPNTQIGLSGTQLSVTLTNVGTIPITFTSFVTQGEFTESDNCAATLAPAARCVLSINFIPLAVGHRTGTLTISDNVGGRTQVVSLEGDGSPGGLVLTPPVLNFGVQTIGVTSPALPATLTNNTGFNISNLVVSPSGEYNETNSCGTTLANGANCQINISITPVQVGAITGTVNVAGTLDGGQPVTTRLPAMIRPQATQSANFTLGVVALTATANPPGVGLSLPNLSFALTAVGTASTGQTLTLTNTGTGLPLTGLIFNSSPEFPFTTDCPTTLVKQASCHLFVTFKPLGGGLRTGFLNILADGGIDVPVPESGLALGPQLTVGANTLVFAARPVATTSSPQNIVLQNTGAQTVIISSITVSSPEFSFVASGCGSLVVKATCGVSVRFTPGKPGLRFGVLTIVSNSPNSPTIINLQGAGTTGGLTFSTQNLAFGTQGVGVASAAKAITITNASGAALPLTSVVITPTGNYTQTNNCGANIAANASCTMSVVFTPTALGEQDASLQLTTSAGTQAIALTGAGSDFSITYSGNLPAASTRNGARTTYTLGLISTGGDSQTVALTCAAGSGFSCSVAPASVAIGAQAGTFTLVLTANGSSAGAPPAVPNRWPPLPWLALGLSLFLAAFQFRRRKAGLTLAGATLLLVFSAACAAPQPPQVPSVNNVTVTAVSSTGATHSKTLNLVIE